MADMRFLRPSEVIERLKATVKGLGDPGEERIGGVEDFDGAEDKARLAPPALYVQLNPGSGSNESLQTGIQQTLIHEFEIVLHLDRTDRRGQYATDQVVKMKMALLRALNGWLPDPLLATSAAVNCNSSVLYYVSDQPLGEDRANVFWSFIFAQEYAFSSDDDGLGMLGNYDDLNDFDDLDLDIVIDPDVDVPDVKISLTDIHE